MACGFDSCNKEVKHEIPIANVFISSAWKLAEEIHFLVDVGCRSCCEEFEDNFSLQEYGITCLYLG